MKRGPSISYIPNFKSLFLPYGGLHENEVHGAAGHVDSAAGIVALEMLQYICSSDRPSVIL
jgi:hypothetical protein